MMQAEIDLTTAYNYLDKVCELYANRLLIGVWQNGNYERNCTDCSMVGVPCVCLGAVMWYVNALDVRQRAEEKHGTKSMTQRVLSGLTL